MNTLFKNLKNIGYFILFSFFLILNFSSSFAENAIIYKADHQNRIIIHGQSGEDEYLFFGDNLSESLSWNGTSQSFIFTDDVNFNHNELQDVRFENRSTEPICNNSEIGYIYHNTTDKKTYICDGTDFNQLENEKNTVYLIPEITNNTPIEVDVNTTETIQIEGNNFTPSSIVTFPSFTGTINSIDIISAHRIDINITTADVGIFDIVISNNGVLNTTWTGNGVNILHVLTSWSDLRAGGTAFSSGNGAGNDIRFRNGMNIVRDANGMYFTGSGPWSSWVKFQSLQWNRGDNKTLQFIFSNPTGPMMMGIGSDATNEGSGSQYNQAEVEAYFNSSISLWGLYGNNGTIGGTGNQSGSATLTNGGIYKIKFTNDGTKTSSIFSLYKLPSANENDWDDESDLITSYSVAGTLNPDESNIMPFIIPTNGGTQRFIAVKVE